MKMGYVTDRGYYRAMVGNYDPWTKCHHWTRAQINRYEKVKRAHLANLMSKGFITMAGLAV